MSRVGFEPTPLLTAENVQNFPKRSALDHSAICPYHVFDDVIRRIYIYIVVEKCARNDLQVEQRCLGKLVLRYVAIV